MANTQRQNVEELPVNNSAFSFPQDVLNAALEERGFIVRDGYAIGRKNGALFQIVAPTDPQVAAHALAEFYQNRIVANRDGVSAVDAVRKAASGESLPKSKSNDAEWSVYKDKVDELVRARLMSADPEYLREHDIDPDKPLDDQDKAINVLVNDTCEVPEIKAKYYAAAVAEAYEAGRAIGTPKERVRKAGKAKKGLTDL